MAKNAFAAYALTLIGRHTLAASLRPARHPDSHQTCHCLLLSPCRCNSLGADDIRVQALRWDPC